MAQVNITKQNLIPSNTPTNGATNPIVPVIINYEDLFKEGMTEEAFVAKYQEMLLAVQSGALTTTQGTESTSTEQTTNASLFSESTDFSEIQETAKKYFEALDKDKDGVLNSDEVNGLASRDEDNTSISDDDIDSFVQEFIVPETETKLGSTEGTDTTTAPETDTTSKANSSSSSNSSGSSGSSGSSSSSNSSSQSSSGTGEKTLEQLKTELTTEQGNLSTQQAQYNQITDGSNAEIQNLKSQEDTAYKALQEALAVQNGELAQKLETAKGKVETEENAVATEEKNIMSYENELTQVNSTISSLEGKSSSYASSISSLEAQKNETSDADTLSKINERITALKSAKEENDKQLETAKGNKQELEQKLSDAKTALEGHTTALQTAQGELTTVQSEIAALNNTEISALNSAYTSAQQATQTKQTELKSAAQSQIQATQTKIADLQKQIDTKEANEINSQGRVGIIGEGTYNIDYNGNSANYDMVLSNDKLNELLKLINDNGCKNNSGHSDMCLAFSEMYCAYINGNIGAGTFQKYRGKTGDVEYVGGMSTVRNDNQNTVLDSIAQNLSNGKPAIVQVSTQSGSRHYVAVIGVRQGADMNNLKESDLLTIDSYDGKVEGLSTYGSRHMITGYSTPNKKQQYGYQSYV